METVGRVKGRSPAHANDSDLLGRGIVSDSLNSRDMLLEPPNVQNSKTLETHTINAEPLHPGAHEVVKAKTVQSTAVGEPAVMGPKIK